VGAIAFPGNKKADEKYHPGRIRIVDKLYFLVCRLYDAGRDVIFLFLRPIPIMHGGALYGAHQFRRRARYFFSRDAANKISHDGYYLKKEMQ
jgi:hypothetical protein